MKKVEKITFAQNSFDALNDSDKFKVECIYRVYGNLTAFEFQEHSTISMEFFEWFYPYAKSGELLKHIDYGKLSIADITKYHALLWDLHIGPDELVEGWGYCYGGIDQLLQVITETCNVEVAAETIDLIDKLKNNIDLAMDILKRQAEDILRAIN